MGWYINLIENELPISDEAAADIVAIEDYNLPKENERVLDGKLRFQMKHKEWMDYVWNKSILDVLLKHKANGQVLFSSSDGDNKGKTWGYRFTDGVLAELVRVNGEWIADDGQDHTQHPTGNRPATILEAKVGDSIAVAVIGFGLTSYEEATVGDILPTGTIVVDGREYASPHYRNQGDIGLSFKLVPIDSPEVVLA